MALAAITHEAACAGEAQNPGWKFCHALNICMNL
jgi:hypothetical protein